MVLVSAISQKVKALHNQTNFSFRVGQVMKSFKSTLSLPQFQLILAKKILLLTMNSITQIPVLSPA
jgi:hypothetical protein